MQYDQPLDTIEVYEGLNFAREALTRLRRPTGKPTSPGLNCRDIKEHNPDFKNGEYWVDPNGGTAVDAILVFCRMETMETCIRPSPSQFDRARWTKNRHGAQYFMGDINGGKEFFYKTDFSQLKWLQLYADGARQQLVFNCFNTDSDGTRLSLYNGDEVDTFRGRYKKSTRISSTDECSCELVKNMGLRKECKDNEWHSAVYDVRTNKTDVLPITDVLLFDVGNRDSQFGIELGEVCFS